MHVEEQSLLAAEPAGERFFSRPNRLRRNVFRRVEEQVAIDDSIGRHDENPKPFTWTAKAAYIIERVKCAAPPFIIGIHSDVGMHDQAEQRQIGCTIFLWAKDIVPFRPHVRIELGQARRIMSRKGSTTGSRVTLHVVSSLDGLIARKDNSVSWLDVNGNAYEAGVSISEEEAATFVKSIDCYVLGSRTYEHALELGWPYGDTPTVVVTGREWPPARESVEFYSGDLETLVDVKLAPRFRNIWLVGGAMLCQRFLELGLVDEIKLTIAPVLLGDGLRLFGGFLTEERWDLKNAVAYKNGFVELSYAVSSA
jgi:Dihydrofolate reductase